MLTLNLDTHAYNSFVLDSYKVGELTNQPVSQSASQPMSRFTRKKNITHIQAYNLKILSSMPKVMYIRHYGAMCAPALSTVHMLLSLWSMSFYFCIWKLSNLPITFAFMSLSCQRKYVSSAHTRTHKPDFCVINAIWCKRN